MHTADVVTNAEQLQIIQILKERHAEQDYKELFCPVNMDQKETGTAMQESNVPLNLEARCSTSPTTGLAASGDQSNSKEITVGAGKGNFQPPSLCL